MGSTGDEQHSLPDPMSRSLWKTAYSGLAALTLCCLWRPRLEAHSGRVEGHSKFIRMSEPVTAKSWQVCPCPQKSPYPLSPTPLRPILWHMGS